VVKHNGPVTDKLGRPSWRAIVAYNQEQDLGLGTWASAEAQVAALADDIAYNNHDVDDGVQAGLFDLNELSQVPLIGPTVTGVMKEFPGLDPGIMRLEAVRRMIGVMVDDVLAETDRRAKTAKVASADDVRNMDHALVAFSRDMLEDLSRLREFLMSRMYRHWRVNRTRSQARRILAEMFQLFMAEPDVMPSEWFARSQNRDEAGRARVVCDYIAGMTDRFAIEEHRKLFHLDVWN
jgi:dGTPase